MSMQPANPAADQALERAERLYAHLPAIYRIRDQQLTPAADGDEPRRGPLFELLRVLAEGADAIEVDIARLYEAAFIETCPNWVVPYIADLVGYRPVDELGATDAATRSAALSQALTSRREVANTIYLRRRKGALHLLEQLARLVAGWPARAVEGFERVALLHSDRRYPAGHGRMADARDGHALGQLGGPFERFTRLAHAREPERPFAGQSGPDTAQSASRPTLGGITLYVWTTQSFPVTFAVPRRLGDGRLTFDPTGATVPLAINPTPEPRPVDIADELNVPVRLRAQTLVKHKRTLYGPGLSLCVYRDTGSGFKPVPAEEILVADLPDRDDGWGRYPHEKRDDQQGAAREQITIDPERGRLVASGAGALRVSYHYGFSAALGAGEYGPGSPPSEEAIRASDLERFGGQPGLAEAISRWSKGGAPIELSGSGVYRLAPAIARALGKGERLHIDDEQALRLRAAPFSRPLVDLRPPGGEDELNIAVGSGGKVVLEGLLLTGGRLVFTGGLKALTLRGCTLAPANSPWRPLELAGATAPELTVTVENSIICGPFLACAPVPAGTKLKVVLKHSIVLGSSEAEVVLGTQGAAIDLDARDCTVIGSVHLRRLVARNSIFAGDVHAHPDDPEGASDTGKSLTAKHCYLRPAGSSAQRRIWREYAKLDHCVPEPETPDLRPHFVATAYGHPQLGRLHLSCPAEIARGADDGGELGVYHDLYLPQRRAVLAARLEEYSVAALSPQLVIVE